MMAKNKIVFPLGKERLEPERLEQRIAMLETLEGTEVLAEGVNQVATGIYNGILKRNAKGDYVVAFKNKHVLNISAYLRGEDIEPYFSRIEIKILDPHFSFTPSHF